MNVSVAEPSWTSMGFAAGGGDKDVGRVSPALRGCAGLAAGKAGAGFLGLLDCHW
jgi:hypothetical protein